MAAPTTNSTHANHVKIVTLWAHDAMGTMAVFHSAPFTTHGQTHDRGDQTQEESVIMAHEPGLRNQPGGVCLDA